MHPYVPCQARGALAALGDSLWHRAPVLLPELAGWQRHSSFMPTWPAMEPLLSGPGFLGLLGVAARGRAAFEA
jgi:hypothetical protein